MNLTEEQIALIKKAKSVAEFSKLAKESGFNISNKEIEEIYNLYHYSNKKMSEAELTNVVAGSHMEGGRTYSDGIDLGCSGGRKLQYLITTKANRCDNFLRHDGTCKNCNRCVHSEVNGTISFTLYCTVRRWDPDLKKEVTDISGSFGGK